MNNIARPPATASLEIGSRVQTNGYATNVHDIGSGDTILFIHGSGPGVSAWANWRLIIPQLQNDARVIAPDMVGFGYTQSPPNVRYDLPLWVDQIAALLDALKVESASIVGNSFGGAVALAFAARYPERVRKLVLMGAAGTSFELTPGLNKAWGYQPSPAAMRELLDLFVVNKAIITDDLVEMRYRASIRADVQQRFGSMFPAPREEGIRRLATTDAVLRSLHHETLLIHGREDQIIPLAASERLKELLPNATLQIFEKCGHWVQIEQAGEFIKSVKAFLLPQLRN